MYEINGRRVPHADPTSRRCFIERTVRNSLAPAAPRGWRFDCSSARDGFRLAFKASATATTEVSDEEQTRVGQLCLEQLQLAIEAGGFTGLEVRSPSEVKFDPSSLDEAINDVILGMPDACGVCNLRIVPWHNQETHLRDGTQVVSCRISPPAEAAKLAPYLSWEFLANLDDRLTDWRVLERLMSGSDLVALRVR